MVLSQNCKQNGNVKGLRKDTGRILDLRIKFWMNSTAMRETTMRQEQMWMLAFLRSMNQYMIINNNTEYLRF